MSYEHHAARPAQAALFVGGASAYRRGWRLSTGRGMVVVILAMAHR